LLLLGCDWLIPSLEYSKDNYCNSKKSYVFFPPKDK